MARDLSCGARIDQYCTTHRKLIGLNLTSDRCNELSVLLDVYDYKLLSDLPSMASEEPLFDPSLKKRKKKTVAFSEDPLGADADPTTPAPADIDNTTANGDAVDMGPTTVHERMKQNEAAGEDGDKKEEDDIKAMFGDLKKKKKKKEIPLDLVSFP